MVVLFDVGPLTDQPFTDSDESDEQHNKADHSPKHRAYCEHQRHSVRLPSLRSAFITRSLRATESGGRDVAGGMILRIASDPAPPETVVLASFPSRRTAEQTLASLGHQFCRAARKRQASALVCSANSDRSLKVRESRVVSTGR